MDTAIHFLRRLGPDPHAHGQQTPACDGCPDLWELSSGDFAVIGIRITAETKALLPPSAGCGADEEIVLVPRRILLDARPDLARLA